jgi:hypothetical protein
MPNLGLLDTAVPGAAASDRPTGLWIRCGSGADQAVVSTRAATFTGNAS